MEITTDAGVAKVLSRNGRATGVVLDDGTEIAARAVIGNLIVGHEAPASAFTCTRSINVPGLVVAIGDMVAALRRVAGDAVADRVRWQLDPAIDRIVSTWPSSFAPQLGPALGMKADADIESIIRAHIADSA